MHFNASDYGTLGNDLFLDPCRDMVYFPLRSGMSWRNCFYTFRDCKKEGVPIKRIVVNIAVLFHSEVVDFLRVILSQELDELYFKIGKSSTRTTAWVWWVTSPHPQVNMCFEEYRRLVEATEKLKSIGLLPSKLPVFKLLKLCERDLD